jgi:hypothetical protein
LIGSLVLVGIGIAVLFAKYSFPAEFVSTRT